MAPVQREEGSLIGFILLGVLFYFCLLGPLPHLLLFFAKPTEDTKTLGIQNKNNVIKLGYLR